MVNSLWLLFKLGKRWPQALQQAGSLWQGSASHPRAKAAAVLRCRTQTEAEAVSHKQLSSPSPGAHPPLESKLPQYGSVGYSRVGLDSPPPPPPAPSLHVSLTHNINPETGGGGCRANCSVSLASLLLWKQKTDREENL